MMKKNEVIIIKNNHFVIVGTTVILRSLLFPKIRYPTHNLDGSPRISTRVKESHWKASSSINSTFWGMVTCVKGHLSKQEGPMLSNESGSVMLVRGQSKKHLAPNTSNEEGNATEVKFSQLENALFSMVSILEGREMLNSPDLSKAKDPILVMVLGIEMDIRSLQPQKSPLGIVVSDGGKVMLVSPELRNAEMPTSSMVVGRFTPLISAH